MITLTGTRFLPKSMKAVIHLSTGVSESRIALICQPYALTSRSSNFNLNMSDVSLSINTVTPLELIVTELVSNVLKHAFPSKKTGKLRLISVAWG